VYGPDEAALAELGYYPEVEENEVSSTYFAFIDSPMAKDSATVNRRESTSSCMSWEEEPRLDAYLKRHRSVD